MCVYMTENIYITIYGYNSLPLIGSLLKYLYNSIYIYNKTLNPIMYNFLPLIGSFLEYIYTTQDIRTYNSIPLIGSLLRKCGRVLTFSEFLSGHIRRSIDLLI